MFLYLSKLVPLFVYPLGLACLLLLIVVWLRDRPRLQRALAGGALLLLWLGGNRLVSLLLLRSLEWQTLPPDPLPQAQAIVVLGGATRMQTFPRPTHEINEAGDRLLYAAWLYHQDVAPVVLLSGGGAEWDEPETRLSEAEAMADLIERMGVPREALLLEERSRNTYENAIESASLLRQEGIDTIVLVTSAMHMPRALGVFARTDLTVIPAPTDFLATEAEWTYYTQLDPRIQVHNLLPSTRELYFTTRVLREYLGILTYRLRGWL